MKKLKKSSNKKPVVIFIYGPIAVGKLTVAKILSKKLGYRLAHNHHINDFVDETFEFGSYGSDFMKDKLRDFIIENLAKSGVNFVVTHCYSHDYVSKAGLTDQKYVKRLEGKLLKMGAKFYPVHLTANPDELLNRVAENSRKNFKKLIDKKKIMQDWIAKSDIKNFPKLKNQLVIDNTNISAKQVAEMVIKHFKLQ